MKFNNVDLETERLSIRLVTEDDSQSLFDVYSDPETMKYWSCSAFTDEAQVVKIIKAGLADFAAGQMIFLAVVLKESNQAIGTMTVFNFNEGSKRAELGCILSRKYWSKGYMYEANQALINYCFDELGLNRLEAEKNADNKAASILLNKLGFRFEGLRPERWIVNGQFIDSEVYGLLKRHFKAVYD